MSAEKDDEPDVVSTTRNPLVFISHDTRDAAIAEAFSKLLSSVSAGVLKSFRSSDKKGNQGIEYGVEWYPEIMKKLDASSDVVCLLTPNSVGRPWILYEAGVAKGKLDTPVHGVALGISLQNATAGPFAQFQNSDDSEDALTQLVIQLVRRIPGSEPDREVVRMQVDAFRSKALSLISDAESKPENDEDDGASVAKLFEEVKVMFQDLPSRIERRFDPDYPPNMKRRRRIPGKLLDELMHGLGRDLSDGIGLLIATSQFKDELPWLYDLALDAHRYLVANDQAAFESLERLEHAFRMTFDHPLMREILFRSKDRYLEFEVAMDTLHRAMTGTRDRLSHRSASPEDKAGSGWTEGRLETLRKMWDQGNTASEIADALGGVSRNAVIGKAHRLGLQFRPSPVSKSEGDEE